jgi:hypothetical protein
MAAGKKKRTVVVTLRVKVDGKWRPPTALTDVFGLGMRK